MGRLAKSIASAWQTGMKVFSFLFRLPRDVHTDPNEFASDILRIQTTPPRPMPRAMLGIALALFVVALLWSAFGRLDTAYSGCSKMWRSRIIGMRYWSSRRRRMDA